MMMEPNQIQNPAPYDGKQPPTFGPRVREPQETLQIRPRSGGAATGVTGPFCRVFQSEGVWYLTGGTVTGGDTNVEIDDIDLGDVGDEPANGTWFWIEANGDAPVEDGVLLPGFDLSTATVGSGAVFPGTNTLPTAAAASGEIHISLGSWSGGVFIPSACGNIQITHCPGTLSHVRL
jgi:hypothetical protein